MHYSKELVGKPVYSIDEGKHLGTVRDIYVDRALVWLAGVHLGREGLLSRKSLLIQRESVAVFGVDAVLAKHGGVVTDSKQTPESDQWLRLEHLAGRQVDTPAGTRVGTLGDVLLDDEARIVAFSLSRVHVEGPIAEHPVIPREALVDTGNEDGVMTVDLNLAEKHSLVALGKVEAAEAAAEAEPELVPPQAEAIVEPVEPEEIAGETEGDMEEAAE
jgi:uncharacterized protein YrrD